MATVKLEKAKKANTICLEIIAKKVVIIEDLEKQIQPKPQNASTSPAMEASQPAMEAAPPEKKILFENCKRLEEHQLAKLRSIDASKKSDSTFVLNSVRFAYCDDLNKLNGKCVKGIKRGKQPAQAMSPEKLNFIKSLYSERLMDMTLPEKEKIEREKKFNRHVHGAITNINVKQNKNLLNI